MKRRLFFILAVALLCTLPSQAGENHTHILDGGTVVTEATCKKAGEILYRCLDPDCDYTLSVEAEGGHCYGETEMVREPACEGKGWGYQICTVCGAKKSVTVEHVGHHMVPDEVLSEADCVSHGTTFFVCTECGYKERVIYPALGHRLDEGTVEAAPTCKKTGVIRYSCTAEDCSFSITDRLDKLEHQWDEGTVTKEATTKSNGAKLCTCQLCGTVKTITIPHLTEEPAPEK